MVCSVRHVRPTHPRKPVIEREAKEPPSTWQWPSSAKTPPCYLGSEAAKLEVEPVGAAVASQLKVPNGQAEKKLDMPKRFTMKRRHR